MPRKRRTVTDVPTVPSTPPDTPQGMQDTPTGQTDTRAGENTETPDTDTRSCMNSIQLSETQKLAERDAAILSALDRGEPYRKISAEHAISIATLSRIANQRAQLETKKIAKLMQAKALDALEAWEEAMHSGAKQGKHAAAKEWLTHARALDPVGNEGGNGAKVAIIIGQPGQPVGMESLQVIHTQAVSSDE